MSRKAGRVEGSLISLLQIVALLYTLQDIFSLMQWVKMQKWNNFSGWVFEKRWRWEKNLKKNQKWSRLIGDLKVGQSAHFLLASSPSNQILLHFALDGPVCYFLFSKQQSSVSIIQLLLNPTCGGTVSSTYVSTLLFLQHFQMATDLFILCFPYSLL